MALGQIPGKSYAIGAWKEGTLRQWLSQHLGELLPSSIQTQDAQLDTISVGTSLTLSTAALADLKTQLGI